MSTKCSLAWGDKFHLYTDCVEKHVFVHLEIAGVEFDASPGQVTVRIPLQLWEYVRAYSPAKYDLADFTDAKLWQLSRKRAAERKKMLRSTAPKSPIGSLIRLHGSVGMREIFRHLQAERKTQQRLRAEVLQLREHGIGRTEICRRLNRRKRVLLPEYKRLMAQPAEESQTQHALDEIRGDR